MRREMERERRSRTHRVWLLGAPDPEMTTIEQLLAEVGEEAAYAADPSGKRVHPGVAYRAVRAVRFSGGQPLDLTSCRVYAVECGGPILDRAAEVVKIDHHNEGDPGHGRSPAEFLPASSVGQAVALLARCDHLPPQWGHHPVPAEAPGSIRWWRGDAEAGMPAAWLVDDPHGARVVPPQVVLVAAADHCPGAAYVAQCPGVDPGRLRAHRLRERAAWLARGPGQGRDEPRAAVARVAGATVEALDAAGERGWQLAVDLATDDTIGRLRSAPRVELGGVEVADLRGAGTLPELPEAALRAGVAVIYRMVPPPRARDRRPKLGIMGAGLGSVPGPAPVEAFLAAARAGEVLGVRVEDPYGDPARGYAGAYETHQTGQAHAP